DDFGPADHCGGRNEHHCADVDEHDRADHDEHDGAADGDLRRDAAPDRARAGDGRGAGIELSSPLQHMGLQADDGGVEVPTDFAVAGWYRGGGRPGGPGPIVLVGHVDSRAGPAVFYRLGELRPGDIVQITVADGSMARYAVTGTEQFPKAEFPTFAVFGATADDVVRLVTCTGEFNRSIRSYYDNLVVTATRVADG
ncbi:MAG: class F sortase, partial [Ilumatobacteraceae bacterium]